MMGLLRLFKNIGKSKRVAKYDIVIPSRDTTREYRSAKLWQCAREIVMLERLKLIDEKPHEKISIVISSIESEITKLKSSGVKIHEVEALLNRAKSGLNENNFEQAKELAEEAKKVANERKTEYDSAVKSISEAEEIFSKIRAEGVVVSDELLTKSEQAFDDGDYSASISLAKEQKNLIAVKKFHKETSAYVSSIESEIAELKSSGVKMQETEGLLKQAKAELNENNFEQAKELANRAKKVASERKTEYDSAVKSISETKKILSEIRAEGVAVPDELLTSSKREFKKGDYSASISLAKEQKKLALW